MSSDSDIPPAEDQQDYAISLNQVRDFFTASQHRILLEQAIEHHAGPALKACTYDKGYIQQPLFSCITCRGGPGEEGNGRDVALCAACAYKCHGEHELEEIYEKRHTRCDCPTLASRPPPPATLTTTTTTTSSDPASPDPPACTACTLNPPNAAYPANVENVYNHNYVGLYCHCNGHYEAGQEAMYQCSLCLDWFHERCMRLEGGQAVPEDGEEGLFMCRACLKEEKYDFLLPYLSKARLKRRRDEGKDGEQKEVSGTQAAAAASDEAQVDLFPDITAKQQQEKSASAAVHTALTAPTSSTSEDTLPGWQCVYCHYFNQPQQDDCFGCEKPKKAELHTSIAPLPTSSTTSSTTTLLPAATCTRFTHLPASFSRSSPPDLWVHSSWQSALCNCDDCITLYRIRAPFLLASDSDDDEDDEEPAGAEGGDDAGGAGGGGVRSADELVDGYLSSLPRHALLDGMSAMGEWNEAVMRRLQALGEQVDEQGEAVLITGDMVRAVTREAKEEVELRRRRRREEMEGLDGADGDGASKRGRFEE